MNATSTKEKDGEIQPSAGVMSRIGYIFGKYTIQWLLLIAVLVIGLTNDDFRKIENIQSVLLQSSFIGIGAAGMTLLIINGAFDLSVAGTIGLCGIVLAKLLPVVGILPAILITVCLGLILGVLNGLVVTKLRIPAFIATLGMMNIFLSVAFILTNAQVVPVTLKSFRFLGSGKWGFLPIPFLLMIVVYILCAALLKYTTFGRAIRAVGSNETASGVAGLPIDKVRILAFMLVGGITALAGILLTAYLSSANAIMATGYELRVIAAAVVGGTSLKGGQGTMLGTFTGALFFTVINNALNMYGVGAYWQYIAVGAIIITALGIEAVRSRFMGTAR